jgi:hypothetical protein
MPAVQPPQKNQVVPGSNSTVQGSDEEKTEKIESEETESEKSGKLESDSVVAPVEGNSPTDEAGD